jgi:hypothetical protein
MLPDKSTASITLLPLTGSSIGSPTHCGLDAAPSRRIQMMNASKRDGFHFIRASLTNPSEEGNLSMKGILKAELLLSLGGSSLTSKGKGSSQKTHGHSN